MLKTHTETMPLIPSPRTAIAATAAVVACLLAETGCGRRVDLPPRAVVRGTVKLNGAPLPRGEVTFVPDASHGTQGPSASGRIDESGRYELTTDHGGRGSDGAVVGFHRVRIQARTPAEPGEPSQSLVPRRYGDYNTSGIVVEVRPELENEIELLLTSP